MESDSRSSVCGEGTLEELMRERIRATIEAIVDEELKGALGAAPSQGVGSVRAGYRHGKRLRTLTTSLGATTIAMPRARIEDDEGHRREWRSQIIPRYQRRTERVNEAILGVYLSGTNGLDPVSLTVLGKKDKEVSQCREPIHHMRRSTGGESSNWRAPGDRLTSWRGSLRPRPTRSANGSSRPDSMRVCAAMG